MKSRSGRQIKQNCFQIIRQQPALLTGLHTEAEGLRSTLQWRERPFKPLDHRLQLHVFSASYWLFLRPSSFSSEKQKTDLSLLPRLTHVCLFKARLFWDHRISQWHIKLPLAPNHFQVSSAGHTYFFSPPQPFAMLNSVDSPSKADLTIEVFGNCCDERVDFSYCNSKDLFTAPNQTLEGVHFLQQLGRSEDPESAGGLFFVHIIKCLELRMEFSQRQGES